MIANPQPGMLVQNIRSKKCWIIKRRGGKLILVKFGWPAIKQPNWENWREVPEFEWEGKK